MDTITQPAPAMEPKPLGAEDRLRLLIQTGLLLASERSLEVIVQAALDSGLRLCGAQYGAFFYNNRGDDGESYPLYKITGLNPSAFRTFPMPHAEDIFDPHAPGRGIVRSDDLLEHPDRDRIGAYTPFRMMPEGTPPVRSYLAVPVRGRSGEILGGMIYGHTGPACFDAECEDLVVTVASQAAIAIDNFRLADNLSHEIALSDAARSLQRQTADRLRQALEAADLGTWSWDRATDLLDLDDRARLLFNVREGEIVTRTALRERMVLIDDQQKTAESLERALRSGGLYRAEYRVEIGGVYAWIAASGLAVMGHGPDGPIITGMVGTVQDVTVRKTQEATLRESEKLAATGRLAATIAHEINNPLEAVTNLIYLCKTDPTVPQHAQRLLETADAELARVAQIAQQTLGFYRDTTRPIQIDLNELLHGVVDLFARKLHYCKLAYQLDLEPDLHIFGLKGEIRQVFSNLFVNAIDASTHGTIRVRAQKRTWHGQPGVVVIIADEGAGIPAVIRDRLFSPFFTTKQSVGTGLGLWVTRGIVEKQGGSVTFRTRTQPPSGTVFRVFLPSCDPLPLTQ